MVKAIQANMTVSKDTYSKTPSDSLSARGPLSSFKNLSQFFWGNLRKLKKYIKRMSLFFAGAIGKARLFFILPF